MFNKDFYPTPPHLITKLLSPYKDSYYNSRLSIEGSVLEPSAGKGDIVQALLGSNTNQFEVHAIEIEEDLRSILSAIDDQNFALIGDDFLTFQPDEFYQYIIMNPPFSNGEDHLLKAIEISHDTEIACILNAETIKNPYTAKRKQLLNLINQYGKYEFIQDAFIDAERKTKVEVALIWLTVKREQKQFQFDYINDEDLDIDFDFSSNEYEISKTDLIGNLKIRSEKVKKAYEEKLRADAKFNYYFNQFNEGEQSLKYKEAKDYTTQNRSSQHKFSFLNKQLKKHMWSIVIQELDIKKLMSSSVLKDFDRFLNQQKKMGFNKENVFSLFQMVMGNRDNILDKAIVEVFEQLTKHGYLENRMYVESWKTNDAYKVNKKMIAPSCIIYGEYCSSSDLKSYGSRFSMSSYHDTFLGDFDKALCYITGKSWENIITIEYALKNKFERLGHIKTGDKFDSTCDSTFFKIKFFKKGTIHLEFKDLELWKEFNFRACKGKNWLPNDEYKTHKNRYENKQQEEKINQEVGMLELFSEY